MTDILINAAMIMTVSLLALYAIYAFIVGAIVIRAGVRNYRAIRAFRKTQAALLKKVLANITDTPDSTKPVPPSHHHTMPLMTNRMDDGQLLKYQDDQMRGFRQDR